MVARKGAEPLPAIEWGDSPQASQVLPRPADMFRESLDWGNSVSEMRLATKLYGSVGALLLGGVLLAGMGAWYLEDLGTELDAAVNKTAVRIDYVDSMRARGWEMLAAVRGAFVFSELHEQEKVAKYVAQFNAASKRFDELVALTRPLVVTDESWTCLGEIEKAAEDFHEPARAYISASLAGNVEAVRPLIPKVAAFSEVLHTTGRRFRDAEMQLLKESATRTASLRSQVFLACVLMSCVLMAVGVVAVFIVRRATRTLVVTVSNLAGGAEQLASAAGQVSASSQSLAQGSSEQAASLEETSASSEEINSMARKNSENSGSAASLAAGSQQKFEQASQSLDEMVRAMEEINVQSDKISKIIKVIDEIAFQTNILALNAAVEAARAGEAGMGFAVVADEVRNLAQRCAQAARDTTALIEESISRSGSGKAKVDQVAAALRGVTEEVAKMKTLVDEVNLSSQEQVRGIGQIGKAIAQMEQVTQKAAANAEESASAAEELSAQSATLWGIVEQLTAMVGGKTVCGHSHRGRDKAATAKQQGKPTADLHALRDAVSHRASTKDGRPSIAPAQDSFELDKDFRELR
jgi:methyl-accepting chemotaxis protein